jgi:outer membrane protein assembly factor BamD (BamD/ComL family)
MSYARFAAAVLLVLSPALLAAQKKRDKNNDDNGYDPAARATVLHVANLYVMADSTNPPIATVLPGHEVVIMNRNGAWVNVFANTDEKEEQDPDSEPEFKDPNQSTHQFSGWIRDQGVVGPKTPNGDAILYGAAAELEAQAAQPHPPKDAAQEAHLLYRRVVDYFPDSPLAPEAAWRSADIRWQLDKQDISSLPSAHEQEAYLRPELFEGALKRVMKMYPNSPYAARAAFDLIDEKLCGDWQGLPKCPEVETQVYLKYADRYPDGPKSAEALYDAAYRQGVLVTMYGVDDDKKDADKAAQNCQAIADQLLQKYPKSDYAARAESIAFRVKQGIPIYGSDRD